MWGVLLGLGAVAFIWAALLVPVTASMTSLAWLVRQLKRLAALRAGRPVLAEATRALTLAPSRSSLLSGDASEGLVRGCFVAVDQRPPPGRRPSPEGTLTIEVTCPAPLPHRIALFAAGGPPPARAPAGDPLRTYDPRFDAAFVTYGRAAGVFARLDADLRAALIDLDAKVELTVEADRLVAVTRRACPSGPELVRIIHRLVEVACALGAPPGPLAPRLLANAAADPEPGVRYENLDLLLREHADTAEATRGLELAWNASEPGIRYLAAIRRGDEGLPFLEQTAVDPASPVPLRVLVLRHLARHAPRARVLPLLHGLLDGGGGPALPARPREAGGGRAAPRMIREPVIALLGRLAAPESLPLLIRLAWSPSEAQETRCVVAAALGNLGDPAAEPCLLAMLEDRDPEVAVAAITALGRVGTSASISAIHRAIQRHPRARGLTSAGRTALARIELRLGPGGRGHLSMVEVPAQVGALSLPAGSSGSVSLATPGAVSLGDGRGAEPPPREPPG